jgi:hypothetical protein
MGQQIVLHEDIFYEYFKPISHPESQHDVWGGHGLETYGKDLDIVNGYDRAFVWTVIDGECGPDQWILPGIHHVNRVCYLITEIPHNWIDVEFRVRHGLSSLTELGLKRQISKLRKIITVDQACAA